MIGQRFTRLVVTGHGRVSRAGFATYRCKCDCGATSDVYPHNLASGITRSCGCLRAEMMRAVSLARSEAARARNDQRVLDVLTVPRTVADLTKRTRARSVRVRETLARLVERGLVVDEGGMYRRAL